MLLTILLTGCRSTYEGSISLFKVDKRNEKQLKAAAKLAEAEAKYLYGEIKEETPRTTPLESSEEIIEEQSRGFIGVVTGLWNKLVDMIGIFKDGEFSLIEIEWKVKSQPQK